MHKDQLIGVGILAASAIGIVVYTWLLWNFPMVVLQVTAFLAAAGIVGACGWIGYTMATTHPAEPIEPLEKTPEEKKI